MDSGNERRISALVAGIRDLRNSSDPERFRGCRSICQVENTANAYILSSRMNPEMEIGTGRSLTASLYRSNRRRAGEVIIPDKNVNLV